MLADSSVPAGSGDVAAATGVHQGGEVGGGVGPSSGEDENNSVKIDEVDDRTNYGANRWPRQETLALLKIRSDMDAAFRDSSHKGPLWEEVSRKLADIGYNRSSKKCKEKFENVYKYHKRTKEGRTGKSQGKTYRFFDQLEALENHPSHSIPPPQPLPPPPSLQPQNPIVTAALLSSWTNYPNVSHVTVPSTTTIIPMTTVSQDAPVTQTTNPTIPRPLSSQPMNPSQNNLPSLQNLSTHLLSSSTSSSTASDEDLEGSRKRKRNWKGFFQRLTKNVINMQEKLQRRLLETVEKRERERTVREEAWRMQEMTRINREHEILIQERSAAAAKDAAVIAFLQNISGQQTLVQAQDNPSQPTPQLPLPLPPPPVIPSLPPPQPRPPPLPATLAPITTSNAAKRDTNGENVAVSTSSRWPKAEVDALIRLRTSIDTKYQENAPKGLLWEEISAGMQRLEYNRSAKRCKEKWENINKYFKKVKENNKRRPEDSKTCPYFHQLDALYREKSKTEGPVNLSPHAVNPISTTTMMEPLMVRPEQQWPPPQENHGQARTIEDQDSEREKMDQHIEEEMEEEEEEDEDGDTEEEDNGAGFEMVENKQVSFQN